MPEKQRTFGTVLRRVRESKNLSVIELAKKANLDEKQVLDIEEENVIPDDRTASVLGRILDIDEGYCRVLLSSSNMKKLKDDFARAAEEAEKVAEAFKKGSA